MSVPETTTTHQPSTATDDQPSGNEAAAIGAGLFRAQYDSLRAEILAAKTSRSAWLIQVASLAGVFLTLGVTNWFGAGMAVLVYPCFPASTPQSGAMTTAGSRRSATLSQRIWNPG